MVARVRNPIDGWGGGQAPMHQVKSASCTPPIPRDHAGKKRGARTCTTKSGGGGDGGKINPRPRQVKSCRVTTPNRLRARLPFKNPD